MMSTDPYQAYAEGSILGSQNPMQLTIALYEAGIRKVQEAKRCLEVRDIMGRANAITKAIAIIGELEASLNPEPEARELTENLARLYKYMQQRLSEANLKQAAEPLVEVEGLLKTMVEGWYTAADNARKAAQAEAALMDYSEPEVMTDENDVLRISYGGYYREPVERVSALAYSF
jgi:flagellar secretion chaperone FliS